MTRNSPDYPAACRQSDHMRQFVVILPQIDATCPILASKCHMFRLLYCRHLADFSVWAGSAEPMPHCVSAGVRRPSNPASVKQGSKR
jgi:hypothetical protein